MPRPARRTQTSRTPVDRLREVCPVFAHAYTQAAPKRLLTALEETRP